MFDYFDVYIYYRCRHENEMEINKIINDQLTCGKCFKQFGSIQALKKHLEAKKCQGIQLHLKYNEEIIAYKFQN